MPGRADANQHSQGAEGLRWGNRVIDLHKAREKILKSIGNDRATFSTTINQRHQEEYVDVRVEYEVCGVHYERGRSVLKIIINVNSMDPAHLDIDLGRFRDCLTRDISANFPFLIKDTFSVSFDTQSLRKINREGELRQFREEMEIAIEAHGFEMDEVLPVIAEFVKDSMGESSFSSLEELMADNPMPGNRPVVEITPPGVPCPYCSGLLSEESLKGLLMKLYMRFRFRDGGHD